MRSLKIALLLSIGAVLLIGATTPVPPPLLRSDAPALDIETTIRPVTQDPYMLLDRPKPGMFRCQVFVHDAPGSNRVWTTKDIVLGPGESGESTNELGNLKLLFRARISKSFDRADTDVTLLRDDKVINRQRSTVWLDRNRGL